MKTKTFVLAAILACTANACQARVNYDADYIYKAAMECDLKPFKAVQEACQKEKEDGKEHKPGCEAVKSVDFYNMEAKLGFGAKYKPLPKCSP